MLAAYGADRRRWPEADRRDLGKAEHGLPLRRLRRGRSMPFLRWPAARQVNRLSLAGILQQVGAPPPKLAATLSCCGPGYRRAFMSRWLAAVPLAASLVIGIYAGTAGTLDSFLPSALTGETVAAGDDPGDLSGVSDIEAMTEEDVS